MTQDLFKKIVQRRFNIRLPFLEDIYMGSRGALKHSGGFRTSLNIL